MSKQFWQTVALTLATILTTLALITGQIFTAQAIEVPNASSPQLIAQVTSISQFSDVQPTDYYFQPLQSLVERYGCVVGFPDGTFKATRPIARAEVAGQLNACLDRVSELIASATADLASSENVTVMQRLLEEFQREISSIRK